MSHKAESIESIAEVKRLWVEDDGKGGWTASLETIRTGALLDIARSLRALLALARCPNVAAGFRAMERIRRVVERRPRRRKLVTRRSR